MSNSLYLSHDRFPFCDLPSTTEEYYNHVQRGSWSTKKEVLESRETLIAALESDEDFTAFWKRYRETSPDSEDYLNSLLDATQPFENSKVTAEYDVFLRCRRLSDVSTSARKKIQSDFDAIRPTLYQSFLEKEAVRLNCDMSDVRPTAPVLSLEQDGKQSEWCSLPDNVLAKIVHRLETREIFQLTLVCKTWKEIVYQNAFVLRRAEHSFTTHLLAFTEWMKPTNVVKGRQFREHYQSFGWSLMKWCVSISQTLETLILSEFAYPYFDVVQLSRQCPNLKHLHFKFTGTVEEIGPGIPLPKLESLITEDSHFKSKLKFIIQVFETSPNLRVYKGKLNARDVISINEKKLNPNAFSNLIALQIILLSTELLEALATLDQLHLRYLHLGDSFTLTRYGKRPHRGMINEEKEAFHHLLTKLNELEVLVSLCDFNLDKDTIKLLTRRRRNLKGAMIWFHVTSLINEEAIESIDGRDHTDDHATLSSFRRMLVEKDPSKDLQAFEFIVEDERSKSFLQYMEIGFSVYAESDLDLNLLDKWSLSHPSMRRQLGIEF